MSRALSVVFGCALALGSLACDGSAIDEGAGAGGSAGTSPQPHTGGRDADPPDTGAPDEPDAGLPVTCGPAGECDLRSVDGCGDGLACLLVRGSLSDDDAGMTDDDGGLAPDALAPMCVAAGIGRDGDACGGPGACGPGLDCTAEQDGVCRRYCCELNTTAGCPRGQFCRIDLEDEAGETTGAALCDGCDGCALLGGGCPSGQGCYPLAASTGACHACLPAGAEPPEASCRFSNECRPGSTCVELGGKRRCAELCAREGDACGAERACAAVAGELFGADVGLCIASVGP